MTPSQRQRTGRLTKQHPALARVPYEQRLPVFNAARRHPSVWGTAIVLIVLWLVLFGGTIIDLTGPSGGRGSTLAKIFLPAIVPAMVIIGAVLWLQHRAIGRVVDRDYPA